MEVKDRLVQERSSPASTGEGRRDASALQLLCGDAEIQKQHNRTTRHSRRKTVQYPVVEQRSSPMEFEETDSKVLEVLTPESGGVAGQQAAKLASSGQAFEYTVLMRGTTAVTVVTDEAGLRVGDCVAVEQGPHVNLRLAADAQCGTSAKRASAKPSATATREAAACTAAKDEVAKAKDEESFNLAERKMRLLCAD